MEDSSRFTDSKLASLQDKVVFSAVQMDAAWIRVQGKVEKRATYQWRVPLAAAAAVVGMVLLTPTGRVWADDLWNRLRLTQIYNIQIDIFETPQSLLLPNVQPFYPQDKVFRWNANSLEEASALAGFPVRRLTLPKNQDSVQVQVQQVPAVERVFDLKAAQADIQRLGRVMPRLPAGIEGARISLEPQGRLAISRYGVCPELVGPWRSCALLVQSSPMVLKLPAGLNPVDYARFSLELVGIAPKDVGSLLALGGGRPTLFMPVEAKGEVRPVRVRGTNGELLVYSKADSGEVAYMLDWEEDGFNFRIFGRDPQLAVKLAETLH